MPEPSSTQHLVELREVCHQIPIRGGRLQLVRCRASAAASIDLGISQGTTLGVVGPAASGKTTLLRLIVRLLAPTSGTITYRGRDVTRLGGAAQRALRSDLQVTFADPLHTFGANRRVADLVKEPISAASGSGGDPGTDVVSKLLVEVGLGADLGGVALGELSVSQRQRVGLARALSLGPSLVALDEPLAGLDATERDSFTQTLVAVQADRGIALVVSGHDPSHLRDLLERTGGRLAVVDLGRIHEIGPVRDVLDSPAHPATVALLHERARGSSRWSAVVPSIFDIPGGCPFHTRCPVAEARCSTEVPESRSVGRERPLDSGKGVVSGSAGAHLASCHLI